MKKLDKDRVTRATVVPRDPAICGNPGKYISMEKGPMADSSPRIRMRKNCFLLEGVIRECKIRPMISYSSLFLWFLWNDPFADHSFMNYN